MFYKKTSTEKPKDNFGFLEYDFHQLILIMTENNKIFAQYKNYHGISKDFKVLLGKEDMNQDVQL